MQTPSDETEIRVAHRPDAEPRPRFVLLDGDDVVGELDYTLEQPEVMNVVHTGVREAYGGRGLARTLVYAAAEHARARGWSVEPTCPYARKVLTRDETYRDVLAG